MKVDVFLLLTKKLKIDQYQTKLKAKKLLKCFLWDTLYIYCSISPPSGLQKARKCCYCFACNLSSKTLFFLKSLKFLSSIYPWFRDELNKTASSEGVKNTYWLRNFLQWGSTPFPQTAEKIFFIKHRVKLKNQRENRYTKQPYVHLMSTMERKGAKKFASFFVTPSLRSVIFARICQNKEINCRPQSLQFLPKPICSHVLLQSAVNLTSRMQIF